MRRGMSLLEVVVAAALFGVVATVMVQMVVPVLRSVTRGNSKSEAQQAAMLVVERIPRELYPAHPDSVAVGSDGTSVLFLSAIQEDTDTMDLDTFGDPVYHKREVVYFDPAQGVVDEQDIPLVPPDSNPEPLVATTFTPHDAQFRERVVARNVVALKLQLTDNHLPLNVSVDTQVGSFTCHMESSGTALLSTLGTALALTPSPTPLPPPPPRIFGPPLFRL
ncbi:MAG: PulJ/GspJ family protein [Candidatus Xenobia bacterium]